MMYTPSWQTGIKAVEVKHEEPIRRRREYDCTVCRGRHFCLPAAVSLDPLARGMKHVPSFVAAYSGRTRRPYLNEAATAFQRLQTFPFDKISARLSRIKDQNGKS